MKSFCSFYENGYLGLVSTEAHLGFSFDIRLKCFFTVCSTCAPSSWDPLPPMTALYAPVCLLPSCFTSSCFADLPLFLFVKCWSLPGFRKLLEGRDLVGFLLHCVDSVPSQPCDDWNDLMFISPASLLGIISRLKSEEQCMRTT